MFRTFGSGSGLDTDPIGAVDTGSGKAKITHNTKKDSEEISYFKVLNVLVWGLESSPVV